MLMGPVSKIRFWKDPPYMLGGVEIPSPSMTFIENPITHEFYEEDLGEPDGYYMAGETVEGALLPLIPDRYTNQYELKLKGLPSPQGSEDSGFWRYCCIHTVKEYDDSKEFLVYAFITDIIQEARANAQYTIRYTIDPWRTFNQNTVFGRGTVTRCADSSYKRPRSLQPRYRTITKITPLNGVSASVPDGSGKETLWVYIVYNHTQLIDPDNPDAGSVTSIRNLYFPTAFNIVTNGTFYAGGAVRMTMPLNAVYYGRLDEVFDIDPNTIIGAWLSPICPGRGVYWDNVNSRWTLGIGATLVEGNTYCGISDNNLYVYGNETEIAFSPSIGTDDTKTYVITDMQGNIAGSLPYGVTFSKLRILTDINSSGGYLIVYGVSSDLYTDFTPTDTGFNRAKGESLKLAAAAGCAWTIPLMQLPIGSNAWSSYVYSGQRDYDVESARLSREQQLINGITGAVASGGISGGLIGGIIKSTPQTAIIGATAGTALSIGKALMDDYFQHKYDDKLQDLTDALYANQSSQLLLPGGSALYAACCEISASVKTGFGALLLELSADSVSAQEIADDISLNGYETQIPCADVTPFITAGGPLRIENMKVGGSGVPQFAISAIKDMFARGVYIINPTP